MARRRARRRAGASEQLISATATFSAANRAAGMPTSTAPQHQFAPIAQGGSISVTIDYGYHWETDALTYTYSLDTALRSSPIFSNTRTLLGFGVQNGHCVHDRGDHRGLGLPGIPDILLYDDKDTDDLASAAAWNCAVLLIDAGPGTTPYDAFVAPLDVVTPPRPSVTAPKRDRLVTKTWTRIPVRVANAAAEGIDARDVAVTGSGKGVKVRPTSFGSLEGQDNTEGHVWARLTKPKADLEAGQSPRRARRSAPRRGSSRAPAPAPRRGPDHGLANGVRLHRPRRKGPRLPDHHPDDLRRLSRHPDDHPTSPTTSRHVRSRATTRSSAPSAATRAVTRPTRPTSTWSFVSPTKAVEKFSYYGPARCTAFDSFTAKVKR